MDKFIVLLLGLTPLAARAAVVSAPARIAPIGTSAAPAVVAPALSASPSLDAAPRPLSSLGSVSATNAALAGPAELPPSAAQPAVVPAAVAENDLNPRTVRQDYSRFLAKLGFRDYPAMIEANLEKGGQTKLQKGILEFNARRYRVVNAARDLAAEVLSGLAEQGYSRESLKNATELSARLLSLQPLEPPSSLPHEIAKQKPAGIRAWLIAATVQRLSGQLQAVVSDVVKTAVPPSEREAGAAALRQDRDAPAAKSFVRRVMDIKASVERVLITSYTDAEVGQTRYAGRALAASLARLSDRIGRPEILDELKQKLRDRGLFLENFLGDTLVLPSKDAASGVMRVKLHNGDFLGQRGNDKISAEIPFAVRPPWKLWPKAWREKVLGNALSLWANSDEAPKIVPGQPVRNRLKQALWGFQKWLSKRGFLKTGYSHVGMARLEEADGVVMAWAMDDYPNSQEGGIRQIGIVEDFAQNGPSLRLGVAHWDPRRVWDAFQNQARLVGYQDPVFLSGQEGWPSSISRADYEKLGELSLGQSKQLAAELARRATLAMEDMMVRLGVGFAMGFNNEIWKAYCASAMMLAYRMGAQFEIQTEQDHWHPLVLVLKKLGVPGFKEQNTEGRIIWPGSLLIDPKVVRHVWADYPAFRKVGVLSDPYTMPAYVEMDRELTNSLMALTTLSGAGEIAPDADLISAAIHEHLDSRAHKGSAKDGRLRSGSTVTGGYARGLEDLLNGAAE